MNLLESTEVGSTYLNTFIKDRPKWIIEFLLGIRSDGNMYAERGHAVEEGVNTFLSDNWKNYDKAVKNAKKAAVDRFSLIVDKYPDIPDNWKTLIRQQVDEACEVLYNFHFGSNCKQQVEVVAEFEGIKIRHKLDYLFDDVNVVDLKSKSKLPEIGRMGKIIGYARDNVRQQVFYKLVNSLTDNPKFDTMALLYITEKKHLMYYIDEGEVEFFTKEIKEALREMKKHLTNGIEWSILNTEAPTLSTLRYKFWSQEQVNKAVELWNM